MPSWLEELERREAAAREPHTIEAQADTAGLTSGQRHGVDAATRYLRGHVHYLRYDTALAQGWPIATGVIEGAVRHTVGDRVEIGGAR